MIFTLSAASVGIPMDFVEVMRELPGDYMTPCGAAKNPNLWSSPDTNIQAERASALCVSECPIRAACEQFGRDTRATGVYGGVRMVGGRTRKNFALLMGASKPESLPTPKRV